LQKTLKSSNRSQERKNQKETTHALAGLGKNTRTAADRADPKKVCWP